MHRYTTASVAALLLIACNGKDKDAQDNDPTTGTTTTAGTTTGGTTTGTTTGTTYEWPTSPDAYDFGDGTFIHTFTIPAVMSNPCCYDWGEISRDYIALGTNEVDNALAMLAEAVADMDFDLQALIDDAIMTGSFVALLEHRALPAADGDYNLVFFRGEMDPVTSWTTASAGLGSFWVDALNFIDNTGEPTAKFGQATITAGQLEASDGTFDIAMPLTDNSVLVLPLQDVRISADIAPGGNGVAMSGGELSGYVTVEDFFGSYNQVIDEMCSCLGLSGDLFTEDQGEWSGDCVAGAAALCTLPEEEVCMTMGGTNLFNGEICAVVPFLMESMPDLDLDGDPTTFEALSAGLRFSGAEGEIMGLLP